MTSADTCLIHHWVIHHLFDTPLSDTSPVWYTTEWYITCLIHHWVIHHLFDTPLSDTSPVWYTTERYITCLIHHWVIHHLFDTPLSDTSPVWYTTEWYITCLIHHWVSITLTAADTWLSCSAVVQNCKNGWQFIWHLLTCWCHKFHSSITVAVAHQTKCRLLQKKKKFNSRHLERWVSASTTCFGWHISEELCQMSPITDITLACSSPCYSLCNLQDLTPQFLISFRCFSHRCGGVSPAVCVGGARPAK